MTESGFVTWVKSLSAEEKDKLAKKIEQEAVCRCAKSHSGR